MDNGWIKFYRCSIDSRVFQNEGLWKVWTWCLLKANHSTQWVTLKTGKGSIEVECKKGQFIFGRHSAAKDLKMNPDTVRKRMEKLKNIENITMQSTKQYTLITIVKWGDYQEDDINFTKQSTKQTPSKRQAITTNKNVKNDKNEKKEPKIFLSDSYEFRLAKLLFNEVRENNPDSKEPNLQTWAKTIDLMIRIDKRDTKEIAKIIRWSQKDNFWYKNIRSTVKLREHYDQLILRMSDNNSSNDDWMKPGQGIIKGI